ncbi:transmembrane protein 59 isoform X2 [Microcaecilia unicolor]|uniref:Transmembrane protein 59 n=1 Tax=Microcaecilia unicolor TaxID=1415580 RepID=A0A6P7Y1J8_9AMPH|nr:transmembrane protein 59 isoform X2 [Microcaecilia unicolor]
MAGVRSSVAVCLFFLGFLGNTRVRCSDTFDTVLGDTTSCHRTCQMTYALHTYPEECPENPICWPSRTGSKDQGSKDEALYACQRGCRLFSICQFVDDGVDLNRTKEECESACMEAYSQTNEQYACNLGCQNQLPFAEMRQEQLQSLVPRVHSLFPLALVRSMWSEMMDSAQSFITSSWTFYLQADDGKIVVFQSKPQVEYVAQLPHEAEGLSGASIDKMAYPVPAGSNKEKSCNHRALGYEDEEGDSILKCLSLTFKNSSWIMTVTLCLSVVVVLWICCATVATAVDQYIPMEKLSIYGDMEYVNEQKLNRYPPATLLIVRSEEENEEAGLLPTKVNLAQSAI